MESRNCIRLINENIFITLANLPKQSNTENLFLHVSYRQLPGAGIIIPENYQNCCTTISLCMARFYRHGKTIQLSLFY